MVSRSAYEAAWVTYQKIEKHQSHALYYKLFLSDMVSEIRLYFYNGIAYNGGGD